MTDHLNLLLFTTKQLLTPRHARWAEILQDYPLTFSYLAGT